MTVKSFKQFLAEGYTAYVLDQISRHKLIEKFPPKFSKFIGHHITVNFGVSQDAGLPPQADIAVVGYAVEQGLEALVVTVNGEAARADGSTYHITWSLEPALGKRPVDSNALVQKGFTDVPPVKIQAYPEFCR